MLAEHAKARQIKGSSTHSIQRGKQQERPEINT
jgi:hypothetical protein